MSTIAPVAARKFEVALYGEFNELEPIAARWSALASDMPFRRFDWMETWWRHYRDERGQLFVLTVSDEHGEVVGIAPWHIERLPGQGRVVQFLGSGDICSDHLSLLVNPERGPEVVEALATWLRTAGAVHWDLLDFAGVDQDDWAIAQLAVLLEAQGHPVDRQVHANCWPIALPGQWDEYLKNVSKSRRDKTRSVLRKAFDSGRAVLHRVTNAEELARAFEILIDLHQKRRNSLSEPGCFASATFTEFHREICQRFLEAGVLRLSWIELDGRPLSIDYSYVGGDVVYYYQGGFEPELADVSPGWISAAVSLKTAIEEGYRVFDYLRGDEPYKASWGGVAQPLVRVRIVAQQRSSRVRFAGYRAYEGVKGWARQLLTKAKG